MFMFCVYSNIVIAIVNYYFPVHFLNATHIFHLDIFKFYSRRFLLLHPTYPSGTKEEEFCVATQHYN